MPRRDGNGPARQGRVTGRCIGRGRRIEIDQEGYFGQIGRGMGKGKGFRVALRRNAVSPVVHSCKGFCRCIPTEQQKTEV